MPSLRPSGGDSQKQKSLKMAKFSISPTFFTEKLRDLWAEGSYHKALNLLDGAEINLETGLQIIYGKLKLVGEHTWEVEPDNWEPDLNMCENGWYPTIGELIQQAKTDVKELAIYKELHIKRCFRRMQIAWALYSRTETMAYIKYLQKFDKTILAEVLDHRTAEDIHKNVIPTSCVAGSDFGGYLREELKLNPPTPEAPMVELVEKVKELQDEIAHLKNEENHKISKLTEYIEKLQQEKINLLENPETTPTNTIPNFSTQNAVIQYIDEQIQLENLPAPESTKDFAKGKFGGWVDPQGKFYPCEHFMEHDIAIGKLTNLLPDEAINNGWIRITKTMHGVWHIYEPRKGLSQKQIDTLDAWGQISPGRETCVREILQKSI